MVWLDLQTTFKPRRMDVDTSDVISDFVIDFYFPDYYNLFWRSNNKAHKCCNTMMPSKICDGGRSLMAITHSQ